jgi:hypothetical protein
MKNRKIFLDGYIELSHELFKAENILKSFVVVDSKGRYISVNSGSLVLANVKAKVGEVVNMRIGIHKDNNAFIIAFDEEGEFEAKKYNTGALRLNNVIVASKLVKCGFCGGKPFTLQEVAECLGITRERVRQIKEKAIRRLKHTSRSKILKTYLG